MKRSELIEAVYTCGSCGYCRFGCPVYQQIGFERVSVRGRMQVFKKLLEGKLDFDSCKDELVEAIYLCAGCENCTVECPTGIEFSPICEALREDLVSKGLLPENLKPVRDTLIEKSNPFGESKDTRGAWIPKQHVPTKQSKYLYFMSCTAAYSLNRVARSVVKILDDIGFEFTILGNEEECCGSPLLRLGEMEAAKEQINKNVEKFDKYGVETIFTACAGCYRTLSHYYPEDFKVLHTVQLFDTLIKDGQLVFDKEFPKKVLYFDGCDLGRHMDVYEEPRNILRAIPGLELVELDYNREKTVCCGGPLMGSFPELAPKIAAQIVTEASEKEAELILTPCATCLLNFKSGAGVANVQIDVQDIAMFLPKFIKKQEKPKDPEG